MKRLLRVLVIGALVTVGAPGCSRSKANMSEAKQTDIATLRKLITLQPLPVDAKWSVTTIGDGVLGPSDNDLWAVVRYSDADFAVISRALKASEVPEPVTEDAPPAWLLADVDLARFRHGSEYVFGPVSDGKPFASRVYSTGFALVLPDHRVLIHFSSR